MGLLSWVKEIEWKHYLVASVITSVGALFIHLRYNSPPDFTAFFMFLPIVWLVICIMMLGFLLLLGGNK